MIWRAATSDDIVRVCTNMREHNAREIFATKAYTNRDLYAAELAASRESAIACQALCTAAGDAAAILAAWLIAPRWAAVFLIATDEWFAIARAAYRHMTTLFIPCVLEPHVNVAETIVLWDGPNRDWLRRLGFNEISPPLPRGNNGELFVNIAWVNPQCASMPFETSSAAATIPSS